MTYNDKHFIYEPHPYLTLLRQRIEPTHYIEVYKTPRQVQNSCVIPILELEPSLNLTKASGYKTLFVWKIKLKNSS